MPGLAGIFIKKPTREISSDLVTAMVSTMHYHNWYVVEQAKWDRAAVARCHPNVFSPEPQPERTASGVTAFLDGELYDRESLWNRFGDRTVSIEGWSDARLCLELFERAGTAFLPFVNGFFVLAIYDPNAHRLILVNDRYGLRPVYLLDRPAYFAFASEVKALLGLPDFTPRINRQAIEDFFSYEHMLEDITWIDGITFAPPASCIQIDGGKTTLSTYWDWDGIRSLPPGSISTREAVEEMARLWKIAVLRRLDNRSCGVLLSGGLDSRSIVAQVPENYPLTLVTFGIPGSLDHQYAVKVAKVRGVHHHFVPLTVDNWVEGRVQGVWETDGLMSMIHMHALCARTLAKHYFDVQIHGFAGDAIAGGSFPETDDMKSALQSKIIGELVLSKKDAMKRLVDVWEKKHLSFKLFILEHHVRRFTNTGTILLANQVESRYAFYDNDYLEFVLSLPSCLRRNSSVYKKMLLDSFPRYYETIPWQKTELPITASEWRIWLRGKVRFAKQVMNSRLGINLGLNYGYTDYITWTRAEPGRGLIQALLLDPNALYRQYVPADRSTITVEGHISGKLRHDTNTVLELLTFEIYLRYLAGQSRDLEKWLFG